MVNSKNKGNTFERKTAEILGDWWKAKFNRSPQSGGASWASENNAVGDIITSAEARFPLVVECKDRENWTLDNVLLNNKEPHTWWQQVVGDAEAVDKSPCLIFKRKYSQIYVALPYVEDVYMKLRENTEPIMRTDFIINNTVKDELYYDVLITTIESLTSLKPSYIRSHYDNLDWSAYRIEKSEVNKATQDTSSIDDMLSNI